ncbi:MAG: hypothetical protein ABI342_03785 [Nitrososphaera sp.]
MTEQICVICKKSKKSHADADTKYECIIAYMQMQKTGGVLTA